MTSDELEKLNVVPIKDIDNYLKLMKMNMLSRKYGESLITATQRTMSKKEVTDPVLKLMQKIGYEI